MAFSRSSGSGYSIPSPRPDPGAAYPLLWTAKGVVTRVFEQRQLQARAASADPALARVLADLTGARRRRALGAPGTGYQGTPARASKRRGRPQSVRHDDRSVDGHPYQGAPRRRACRAAQQCRPRGVKQQAPPADAAVVDFFHYAFFASDAKKPGLEGKTATRRCIWRSW